MPPVIVSLAMVPVFGLALLTALPRERAVARWRPLGRRALHALRYKFTRVKLRENWWEQFERDFSTYAHPLAVRARDQERTP